MIKIASRSIVVVAIAAAILIGAGGTAFADAYLRVIAQKAPVHTGPAPSYREIYIAKRGEVLEVLERGTRDYWFKVALEDGTSGWILGDMVYPFEVGDEGEPGIWTRMGRAIRRAILGPSPVPYANVEVSFSAGLLDNEGMYLLRPSYLVDPYFAIDAFAGISPRGQTDLFLGGVGWTLRLVPGAVLGPYIGADVGAAHVRPKADNFVDKEETLMALSAGGGFEITFKKQITVRLDARNWTLFDQNKSSNGQELTGGLAIFF
jgi:Bacterial SH3 domain